MSQWISVEDRMPTKGENVLVFAKAKYSAGEQIVIDRLEDGEKKPIWLYTHRWFEVTHWMPLPEPPGKSGWGGKGVRKECWNCAGDIDGIGCEDCKVGYPPSNWRAGEFYVPDTNADRIRSMSDEELADFLDKCEAMGYQDSSISRDKAGNCMNMLEWLRQQAEEE